MTPPPSNAPSSDPYGTSSFGAGPSQGHFGSNPTQTPFGAALPQARPCFLGSGYTLTAASNPECSCLHPAPVWHVSQPGHAAAAHGPAVLQAASQQPAAYNPFAPSAHPEPPPSAAPAQQGEPDDPFGSLFAPRQPPGPQVRVQGVGSSLHLQPAVHMHRSPPGACQHWLSGGGEQSAPWQAACPAHGADAACMAPELLALGVLKGGADASSRVQGIACMPGAGPGSLEGPCKQAPPTCAHTQCTIHAMLPRVLRPCTTQAPAAGAFSQGAAQAGPGHPQGGFGQGPAQPQGFGAPSAFGAPQQPSSSSQPFGASPFGAPQPGGVDGGRPAHPAYPDSTRGLYPTLGAPSPQPAASGQQVTPPLGGSPPGFRVAVCEATTAPLQGAPARGHWPLAELPAAGGAAAAVQAHQPAPAAQCRPCWVHSLQPCASGVSWQLDSLQARAGSVVATDAAFCAGPLAAAQPAGTAAPPRPPAQPLPGSPAAAAAAPPTAAAEQVSSLGPAACAGQCQPGFRSVDPASLRDMRRPVHASSALASLTSAHQSQPGPAPHWGCTQPGTLLTVRCAALCCREANPFGAAESAFGQLDLGGATQHAPAQQGAAQQGGWGQPSVTAHREQAGLQEPDPFASLFSRT